MEVHAHSHPSSGSGHRKKWTHYLWEFLMLFLAVFCGFLAENQREHYVEKHRAKEYAKSLLKDLQKDTADIRKAALYENRVSNIIDSVVDFIYYPNPYQKGGRLYYYMRMASWRYDIDWNRATMTQLINSGNLRYFTNASLVNAISDYNTITNLISNQDETIFEKRNRAVAYKDHILIAKYEQSASLLNMDDVMQGTKQAFIDSLMNLDYPLQKNSGEMLNAFANALLDTKGNRQNQQKRFYPKAIELANRIMDFLKKEYNLE